MNPDAFSWLALLAATVAGFAAGGVWYAPFLFGPLWSRLNPLDPEHTGRRDVWRYAAALTLSFAQALILYLLLRATETLQPAAALWMGVLLWGGFTAAPSLAEAVFSRRSLGAWLLDSGHRLLVTLVMALVLVLLH